MRLTSLTIICCRHAVFQRFPEAGIALHAFDAHGHGRSDPQDARDRCLIWSFEHLVSRFLPHTLNPPPPPPPRGAGPAPSSPLLSDL